MPLACKLTLDLPPSVNELYTTTRHCSKKYRAWKDLAGWQITGQPRASFAGPFKITLLLPEKMRGDCDNRIKAALDLIVSHRIVPDDRYAKSVTAERSADVEPGKCVLIVENAA